MTPSPFAKLSRANAATLAGDAFVAVALAGSLFFTSPIDAARGDIARYLLITMTPFALVAPVLGPLLDRARGQRVLVAAATMVGRAIACVLMARHLQSLLLYPEAFGVLVLMKGYQVTKSSLVPTVVSGRDDLVRANSRLTLAGVVGGGLAGLVAVGVLRFWGPSATLVFGAIVYVGATVLVAAVPASAPRPGASVAAGRMRNVHLAPIRLAALAMAIVRAGVGFLTFLLAFALKRAGEPAWFYGALIGISAVGGLLGSVAAPRIRRVLREEAVLVLALALPAGVAVLAARAQGRPAAIIVAFAIGLGGAAGRAGFDSLVQRDAPDTSWGRAFARYEAYFQVAWVLGAFVPVLISMSTGAGFVVLALGLSVGAFVYLAGLAADTLVHR